MKLENSWEVTTLLLIALKIGINTSIFMRMEISRILHNSFAITWGILGIMILVLLLITN